MKKMKDKVKKNKVYWFTIIQNLDEGKFLPGLCAYFGRLQLRNSNISFNRVCCNYFKMIFGSTTTAIVRCAVLSGMTYDDLFTYYKNGKWLVDYLVIYHVPRYKRFKKKKDDYELL